jgi:hypothetical protein
MEAIILLTIIGVIYFISRPDYNKSNNCSDSKNTKEHSETSSNINNFESNEVLLKRAPENSADSSIKVNDRLSVSHLKFLIYEIPSFISQYDKLKIEYSASSYIVESVHLRDGDYFLRTKNQEGKVTILKVKSIPDNAVITTKKHLKYQEKFLKYASHGSFGTVEKRECPSCNGRGAENAYSGIKTHCSLCHGLGVLIKDYNPKATNYVNIPSRITQRRVQNNTANSTKEYKNHCWSCASNISSSMQEKCTTCSGYKCSSCSACFC